MDGSDSPNLFYKTKMIKLIKNKLSPISQTKKYPLGKDNFLDFKSLQKVPKLKKQPYNHKARKSSTEEVVMNTFINRQLNKDDQKRKDEIYEKPKSWLKIWKKTGDSFQKDFLSSRQTKPNLLEFPQATLYPSGFRSKFQCRNSEYNNLAKMTKTVLKKVEVFKQRKNEEILSHSLPKQQSPSQSSECLSTFLTQKEAENEPVVKKEPSQEKLVKLEESSAKKNEEWIFFITQLIFEANFQKSEEERLFEQYTARKDQNKIKDYIQIFQKHSRRFKSCHIDKTCESILKNAQEDKKYREIRQKINVNQICKQAFSLTCDEVEQEKENVMDEMNGSAGMRLKRLKSKCKSIQKENLNQVERRGFPTYNSSKMRINSNHKKIIETARILCSKN